MARLASTPEATIHTYVSLECVSTHHSLHIHFIGERKTVSITIAELIRNVETRFARNYNEKHSLVSWAREHIHLTIWKRKWHRITRCCSIWTWTLNISFFFFFFFCYVAIPVPSRSCMCVMRSRWCGSDDMLALRFWPINSKLSPSHSVPRSTGEREWHWWRHTAFAKRYESISEQFVCQQWMLL